MRNFFDCKDEKITEKAFSHSLLISIFGIILCLIALCSITYAWFTTSTESERNVLSSGSFYLAVSVENSVDGSEVLVTENADLKGVYSCLLPAGRYTVRLKMTDESTVKGYCFIKLGSEEHRTEAILNANVENSAGRALSDPFVFTIEVSEETEVVFEPRWGEAAVPTVAQGGVCVISSAPTEPIAAEASEESNETEIPAVNP